MGSTAADRGCARPTETAAPWERRQLFCRRRRRSTPHGCNHRSAWFSVRCRRACSPRVADVCYARPPPHVLPLPRVSHLPWLLRSLRGMAQHAARVRSRVPTRLILVVGNPVDPTSPVGAPLVKNDAQLAEALDQQRANITSFDIHMDVTIVQPLDRSQRTASGVVQAIKQWPGGGGLAPAHDPRGVWAQSPWVAAAVACGAEPGSPALLGAPP